MDLEQQRAIEAVLVRYATAADTRDKALLTSCFTADVKAEYGQPMGSFDGREALVGHMMASLTSIGPTLHYITNIVLTTVPGGVKARSYTQAVVRIPGVEAPIRTAGTYDDLLVQTSEGWQIKNRVYAGIA